jgi:hypothetical protein
MALWRAAHWAGVVHRRGRAEDAAGGRHCGRRSRFARSVNVILVEGENLDRDAHPARRGRSRRRRARSPPRSRPRPRRVDAVTHACHASGEDQRVEVAAAVAGTGRSRAGGRRRPRCRSSTGARRARHPRRGRVRLHRVHAAHRPRADALPDQPRDGPAACASSTRPAEPAARWRRPRCWRLVFGVEVRELDLLGRSAARPRRLKRSRNTARAWRSHRSWRSVRSGGPMASNCARRTCCWPSGFERIKFPLAITCMIAMLAMFVQWNARRVELRNLEIEIGLAVPRQERTPKKPAVFYGMFNSVFDRGWFENPQQFRTVKTKRQGLPLQATSSPSCWHSRCTKPAQHRSRPAARRRRAEAEGVGHLRGRLPRVGSRRAGALGGAAARRRTQARPLPGHPKVDLST